VKSLHHCWLHADEMNYRGIYWIMILSAVGYGLVLNAGEFRDDVLKSPPQATKIEANDAAFNPLLQISRSFPGSIKINEKKRLLEFCADNSCDGFSASNDVSISTLKDLAYLYIYYFSDYLVYLPGWRKRAETRIAAEHVLSRPEYSGCKNENDRNAARCVLFHLSRNGRIKLLFIRYDEGERGAMTMDIVNALSDKKSEPK
jgi:hypothetical protein